MLDEAWSLISRFFYHVVTLTCMGMFPCRWRRKLPALAICIFLSGTLSILTTNWVDSLLLRSGFHITYLIHQAIIVFYLSCFVCILYRGNVYSMLLTVLLAMSLAAQVGFILGGLMMRYWADSYSLPMLIVRDALGYGSFALYYITLNKYLNFTSFFLTRRDHCILLIVACINYLVTCYSINLLPLAEAASLLFYSVSLFATCTITFLIFRYTKDHQKTLDQQLIIQDLKLSEHTLAQMQETAAQMREWKHELSNHLIYVQQLVRSQQYDALDHYAASLQDWDAAIPDTIVTNNGVVNSILNQKNAYARSLGIQTEFHAVLPDTLPVDDLTLCSLLGNLLNNAIEACRKQDAPFIRLDIHPMKQYLAVQIDNSVAYDVMKNNPHLLSTKEDAENHGIGIRVIKRIVEKYDGLLHYEMSSPDCFTVQVLLKL